MAWKDQLKALRQEVHDTFEWEAVLHHNTAGDIDCKVKWHREGAVVGRDSYAQMLLEEHELVFLLDELDGNLLAREDLVTLTADDELELSFKIMDVFPDNGLQVAATVSLQ